jgi:hypothetical protein
MSDLLGDGNIKVSWCTTISNIHAPTAAEINAGTSLEDFITPTGLKIAPTTAAIDTSSLSSTFTTQGAGRRAFPIDIEFKRQTPVDVAYNLLPWRTSGYLVVRRTMACKTAIATGQVLEVYPVQTGERQENPPAMNEVQKFVSPMYMTGDPDKSAVVA